MTAIELKKRLIQQIAEINDEAFLDAIKTILDAKTKSQKIVLTEAQRLEILESKLQFEQGLFLEQKEVDKDFERWLAEK